MFGHIIENKTRENTSLYFIIQGYVCRTLENQQQWNGFDSMNITFPFYYNYAFP